MLILLRQVLDSLADIILVGLIDITDVIGLDPATGAEVWRAESEEKFGSPVVTTVAAVRPATAPARVEDLSFATPLPSSEMSPSRLSEYSRSAMHRASKAALRRAKVPDGIQPWGT